MTLRVVLLHVGPEDVSAVRRCAAPKGGEVLGGQPLVIQEVGSRCSARFIQPRLLHIAQRKVVGVHVADWNGDRSDEVIQGESRPSKSPAIISR